MRKNDFIRINYINGRKTTVLTISDVPYDDPKVIASGPLSYDDSKINYDKYEKDIIEKLNKVCSSSPAGPRPCYVVSLQPDRNTAGKKTRCGAN